MSASEKIGVIDVGGGLRGIYATAVFDYCLDNQIQFDLGIGISAGSANVASYLAHQRKRNYTFYSEYMLRKECMSLGNFIKKKSYLDLDYVYSVLSNSDGENPLDYEAMVANPTEYIVIATDAQTGKATYFGKDDFKQDDYNVLKASCAIPFVCHPYLVEGKPYYDGALGDPVPIQKAFELGCDKVVLILTKPKDTVLNTKEDTFAANKIEKKYPLAAESLRNKAEKYYKGLELAEEYEKLGKVLIVAPDDTCGVDTLTKDKEALNNFYEKGYKDASAISNFVK